jgi:hypothetical protein
VAWLSRNNFTASDVVHADDLNNLANDIRTWGGPVNGGGQTLSNVVLGGSITYPSSFQTPWLQDVSANGHALSNVSNISTSGIISPPGSFMTLSQPTPLGTAAGNTQPYMQISGSLNGNLTYLQFFAQRVAAGTGWGTSSVRMQEMIDASPMGYVEFNPGGGSNALALGTVNQERMRITSAGNVGIGTSNPLNLLSVMTPANPSGLAGANQISIHENSNNSAYRLNLGYTSLSGTWVGAIQALNNGPAAGVLLLQPSGGAVLIGAPTSAGFDPILQNDNFYAYINEAGNTLTFRVKYSTGVIKTGTIALT